MVESFQSIEEMENKTREKTRVNSLIRKKMRGERKKRGKKCGTRRILGTKRTDRNKTRTIMS